MGIEIVKIKDKSSSRKSEQNTKGEAKEDIKQQAPRLLNRRFDRIPPDAVYIGRPSKYGNPFTMRQEKDRDGVCDAYNAWIWLEENAELRYKIKTELKGKDLICYCAPKRCHGETVMKIANEDYYR